jgi:alpha-L-arabinofuranosidase
MASVLVMSALPGWAWGTVESNQFGTDEFVEFCRAINTQPYLIRTVVMRHARRDWVET